MEDDIDIKRNLETCIKLLGKKAIDSEELEFMSTTAYHFFLITHWNMLSFIDTAEQKQEFITDLLSTLNNNLQDD